ncbi:low-specificity L-threonine aldolase [candidate division KSB1 bacterium]|nr:low-specificity L-threonine aldolase [candidate division KSB1 bacterium]RQW01946.1 MAG: low-specificity L-threonine aldolase [candidate division KSB1 bacterium]
MNHVVDLRSDTLTRPTAAMRQAMADAPVGDDVFGEDPTMNELQRRVAELCGKEAALFVPSGTMSNQIAINAHTQPGDEIICEYGCHIFNYEGGAPALLSGVQLHPLHGQRGVITAEHIQTAIRPKDHHFAQTRLIEIENTHNRAGGAVFPLDEIQKIRSLADEHDLKMHLDGARLWNAYVATGISLKEWSVCFDSISLCFSKGLGAPIGSILVGSAEFIDCAHRYRKIYGGGMRQVGVIAAAALYALDCHIERLAEDHKRAHQLALKLIELGAYVDLEATQTNIVIADCKGCGRISSEVNSELARHNVLAIPVSPSRIRFVTHLDIDDDDLAVAMNAFECVLS